MLETKYLSIFKALSSIPHGSGNTKAISDFCVAFAKERNLDWYQDSSNNVIIRKPGTKGYKRHPIVVLQGHLDMVCEMDAGSLVNPNTQPLDLRVDGDYLYAKGTTLGGDDGIAVAYCLAILDDDSIPHPPLEVVLTTDEEIGMIGASKLDPKQIKGRTLINMDSEEEGTLLVGCAGGAHAEITIPVTRENVKGKRFLIRVSGLPGGHSGTEINQGHANADFVLYDAIRVLSERLGFALISLEGGTKDNAIPREAQAQILLPNTPGLAESLSAIAEGIQSAERGQYPTDSDLTIQIDTTTEEFGTFSCLTRDSLNRLLAFFAETPNGVQSMSSLDSSLVQTSLNLGILQTHNDSVRITFSVRSSVNSEKDALLNTLKRCTDQASGTMHIGGEYPAWEYIPNSNLQKVMIDTYESCYGSKPIVATIHAGLECGLFCDMLKGLDCVSCGPNMIDIHTPRERLSLSSAERTWNYIIKVLENL